MTAPNFKIGLLAALGMVALWTGFVVFGRLGIVGGMTPYDIVALRFIVAGALTLPVCIAWWPRHLPLKIQAMAAICGPGAVYSILAFSGLAQTSAAHAGVFSNGSLPIAVMLLSLAVLGAVPGRAQLVSTAVILIGSLLVGWHGITAGGADVAAGIAFFVAGSVVLSMYMVAVRVWQISPYQALAMVNIPNALVFLPLWYFALPSGMAETGITVLLAHALFQGIGPGFCALMLFTVANYHLGAGPTAAISAAVPALAALMAIPVLGEIPSPLEWIGIVIVCAGLGLLIRAR